MTETRNGLVATLVVVGLATLVPSVAAQTGGSSTTDGLIWGLNTELLAVAIPITILVEAILFYTVWRFRAAKSEGAKPTQENRRLEVTWTVTTAIVLLFVGVASYGVLAQDHVTDTGPSEDALEVDVIAEKYSWTFHYPEQNVTTMDTLVLPVDQEVRLNVTSTDWIHSFHVPDMGLKQDAFPGGSNHLTTEPTETGSYQLYCAEFCGVGHSSMLGTVEVKSQEGFQDWLDQQSE
ncbi:cytochrome c oxidase subunit II [Halorhabdus tiamatea]|nr:cytochrome c oxidase subunit II [Halorhabdus tiamatea]